MAKKKKPGRSVRRILEEQRAQRELKQLDREPRPLVPSSFDENIKLPLGYENMTKQEIRIDSKRRAKYNARRRPKTPQGTVRVTFRFTPNELGVPAPTKSDYTAMMETNPALAQKYKYYNPLNHMIEAPDIIERDPSVSFSKQWDQAREIMRIELMNQRDEMMAHVKQDQNMIGFDPSGPSLNLGELTTAEGDE